MTAILQDKEIIRAFQKSMNLTFLGFIIVIIISMLLSYTVVSLKTYEELYQSLIPFLSIFLPANVLLLIEIFRNEKLMQWIRKRDRTYIPKPPLSNPSFPLSIVILLAVPAVLLFLLLITNSIVLENINSSGPWLSLVATALAFIADIATFAPMFMFLISLRMLIQWAYTSNAEHERLIGELGK